jgi:hypothetical protein
MENTENGEKTESERRVEQTQPRWRRRMQDAEETYERDGGKKEEIYNTRYININAQLQLRDGHNQ